MAAFANLYWSSDYKTGIGQLKRQSTRSLGQLHELRQLVFNFMNYFHSNSEHMNKLAIDSYSLDSQFRPYDSNKETYELAVPNNALKRLSDTFKKKRVVSGQADVEALADKDIGLRDIDVGLALEVFVKYMTEESHSSILLASQIDREILEIITTFIKINEPQIHSMMNKITDLIEDYELRFKQLDKLKSDYDECLRLHEFVIPKHDEHEPPVSESGSDEEEESLIISKDADNSTQSLETEFNFPLIIGTVKVSTASELSDLLNKLIKSTPVIKRKIPMPGSRNEIFVSGDLCKFLIKHRPFGLNPSTVNLERFGQTLIDLKLIIGTGFWSSKFKKEDMWFEWSDLAFYVSEYQKPDYEQKNEAQKIPKVVLESTFVNEMAQTTSKKFNNMFQNMKTSLKKYSPEMIPEIEKQYSETYLDLQETKFLIDKEILQAARTIEKFEVRKIEIIYQSLTKLLEVLYNSSLSGTNKLHTLASDFINSINLPENYQHDFDKLIDNFSTGIYFPSNISPENLLKKQYNTSQTNNSFQNIKTQFNLFKDIPLQLLLNTSENNAQSISSLPIFLYEIIKLIETKDVENFEKYYTSPINHEGYWKIKAKTIQVINSFEIHNHLEIAQENSVHKQILDMVLKSLESESGEDLINFLKNWLLQTTDSLIPCMVYDQIIDIYKKHLTKDKACLNSVTKKTELTKQLSTISRSNLSSLIYVLEHISKVFNLKPIPNYPKEDKIPEIENLGNLENLDNVVQSLNSMDAIGSVPFTHLILRPASSKSSSGFKPPFEIYNELLSDLLQLETRVKLLELLLNHERVYRDKKERENSGLQIKKLPPPKLPSVRPRSPSPNRISTEDENLNGAQTTSGDVFTLRPFRTKLTPVPSPATSPSDGNYQTANNSAESISSDATKQKSTTPTKNKNRPPSLGLTPSIAVEFEEKLN